MKEEEEKRNNNWAKGSHVLRQRRILKRARSSNSWWARRHTNAQRREVAGWVREGEKRRGKKPRGGGSMVSSHAIIHQHTHAYTHIYGPNASQGRKTRSNLAKKMIHACGTSPRRVGRWRGEGGEEGGGRGVPIRFVPGSCWEGRTRVTLRSHSRERMSRCPFFCLHLRLPRLSLPHSCIASMRRSSISLALPLPLRRPLRVATAVAHATQVCSCFLFSDTRGGCARTTYRASKRKGGEVGAGGAGGGGEGAAISSSGPPRAASRSPG